MSNVFFYETDALENNIIPKFDSPSQELDFYFS